MKLGIIGNFTLDFLLEAIYAEIDNVDITLGGFDQFRQNLLSPSQELKNATVVICILDWRLILQPLYNRSFTDDAKKIYAYCTEQIIDIGKLIYNFRKKSNARILVSSPISDWYTPFHFLDHSMPMGQYYLFRECIQMFDKQCLKCSEVYPLDMDMIASYIGKKNIYDPRMDILASSPYSVLMLDAIAKEISVFCKQIQHYPLKCMVLDLDNTLWGGVVGEDGIDGILLDDIGVGKAFKDFQRSICRLAKQGILLAICSKNNHNDAMEVFKKHPHMVIKLNMLASIYINWKKKEENIRAIASELNIGLDSLLFVDDNPMERAAISSLLPQVEILDLPKDPAYFSDTITHFSRFIPLQLTKEDTQKNKFFVQNRQRKEDENRESDIEKFLYNSAIVAFISEAHNRDLPRLVQLYNKTNQFNLTTQRYTEEDLRMFIPKKDCTIWCMRLKDRYGNYGLVGSALIVDNTIDSFVLSCRAFGRNVEQALLHYAVKKYRKYKNGALYGHYVSSEKNAVTKDFYKTAGFEKYDEESNKIVWILEETKPLPQSPSWITINEGEIDK